jgi:hypothetical protein
LVGLSAELKISPRHLQTLCQEQGGIGVDEQTERTTAYQERPLMTPHAAANPPIELASVMVDGGRIQVRQPDQGPGVHEPAWRETKTAVLLCMKRQESAVDPQPELPSCFAAPLGSAVEPPPTTEPAVSAEKPDWKPVPVVRSGLATLNKTGRHRAAPLRSWPLGRRSGRVATEPYPPPRPSLIIRPSYGPGNDSVAISPLADSRPKLPSSVAAPHRACGPVRRGSPGRDRPACPRGRRSRSHYASDLVVRLCVGLQHLFHVGHEFTVSLGRDDPVLDLAVRHHVFFRVRRTVS